jgi:hypothetical protein
LWIILLGKKAKYKKFACNGIFPYIQDGILTDEPCTDFLVSI